MAKTLLNAVNQIFRRVNIIAGDSGELTSLTDSARQSFIDTAVQVINEGVEQLYNTVQIPMPQEQAEDQIVLATDVRIYPLPDDLVTLIFPLVDRVNTQFIYRHEGGYNDILLHDPEQDDTGIPLLAAISPLDGQLFLDRAPTATENGNVYTLQYHRDVSLTLAADKMPFNDTVFRGMVPAWSELWKREKRKTFDDAIFSFNIGRAARVLNGIEARTSWSPRR